MAHLNLSYERLLNQHVAGTRFQTPADVVAWLGAVQAQDYVAAKWALGVRLPGVTDAAIEQAFADGLILRTHVMRPTWHFVSPADIRWMLALTAPRINTASGYYHRKLELDRAIFVRSNAAVAEALQGGHWLTRSELALVLEQVGIATGNLLRLTYLVGYAETAGLICSGPRRGKQFTYALLDERAPVTKTLARDEALATLAQRYFTSHGPATLQDYTWWSGLTAADAKAGLEMVKSQLVSEVIDEETYWFADASSVGTDMESGAFLLPNFDEYLVGYANRSAVFDRLHNEKLDSRGSILSNHSIVMDGQIIGTWKRTFKKGAVILSPALFRPLIDAEDHALAAAADRYGRFLELPVEMV